MLQETTIALRMAALTLVLTGIVYPLTVTGLAQALFPWRAGGSLIEGDDGAIVGSELIGQRVDNPAYFHGRPSAGGYDGAASGGSNLGPTSKALRDRVTATIAQLRLDNPEAPEAIPADLVLASGSGLDPHVSPEAALWQVARVATARGLRPGRVQAVVEDHVKGRQVGFLGERRVSVLLLNLAIDRQFGKPAVAR